MGHLHLLRCRSLEEARDARATATGRHRAARVTANDRPRDAQVTASDRLVGLATASGLRGERAKANGPLGGWVTVSGHRVEPVRESGYS